VRQNLIGFIGIRLGQAAEIASPDGKRLGIILLKNAFADHGNAELSPRDFKTRGEGSMPGKT
jgi:hypothetical protein